MSIYGVSSDSSLGLLSFRSKEEDELDPNSKAAKRQDLDGDGRPDSLDGVTLSSMSTKLAEMTKLNPMANVVDTMSEDLANLQNRFMQTLEEDLALLGVDVEKAFTLKADAEGNIVVQGEHPDKEAIEAVANSDLQLNEAFGKIIEQSKLIDSVRNNPKNKTFRRGLDAYRDATGDETTDMFLIKLSERTMLPSLAEYL